MSDKPKDRGVVDSIARLREQRYMTKGAGAKRARKVPPLPSIEKLRSDVAEVSNRKPKKRKSKR